MGFEGLSCEQQISRFLNKIYHEIASLLAFILTAFIYIFETVSILLICNFRDERDDPEVRTLTDFAEEPGFSSWDLHGGSYICNSSTRGSGTFLWPLSVDQGLCPA